MACRIQYDVFRPLPHWKIWKSKCKYSFFCDQVRSSSRRDLNLTWGGHVAYHLMQLDERNISAPSLCLCLIQSKVISKNGMLTLWRHYMTLNSLSRCHICKNGPEVITISLNDHGSERFEQIWWVYSIPELTNWVGKNTLWIWFFHSFSLISLSIFHSHPLKIKNFITTDTGGLSASSNNIARLRT